MYFATIPYVHDLIGNGDRQKARAFWEYCYDMEHSVHNVDYAQSWGIDELTAKEWVSEFYTEINNEISRGRKRVGNHTKGLDR